MIFQKLFLEEKLPARFREYWVLEEGLEIEFFSSHPAWFIPAEEDGWWDYSNFADFCEQIKKENKFGLKSQTREQKKVEQIFNACFDESLMRAINEMHEMNSRRRIANIYMWDMREDISQIWHKDQLRNVLVGVT